MKTETAAVWDQFRAQLFSFIRSKVRETADAEDLLQDVFIRVHRSLSGLKNEEKLQSWLFVVARNVITDHLRKKAAVWGTDAVDIADRPFEQKDLLECMWPFVDQLPKKYRDAIRYCDIEGHTQQQLAERETISLPGAKSRLQRARKMLKTLFTSCCHIQTDRYGNIVEHIPKGHCACA